MSATYTAARLELLESRRLLSGNAVLEWNQVWLDVVRVDPDASGPAYAARNVAMLHAAIYDAVAAVRGLEPLFASVPDADHAAIRAAIAGAASRMLSELYPAEQQMIEHALEKALEPVRDGAREDKGLAIGTAIAEQIIAQRAEDGSQNQTAYTYTDEPGHYQASSDNPNVVDPGWGSVTPFIMESGSQYHPGPMPDLTSAEYAEAYNQVKELGALDSTTRTAEQTEIGYFWAYDRAAMGTPTSMLNHVLQEVARQQQTTLIDSARLLAAANIAMADAGIAAWEAKYYYDFWRPVTAIQNGDTDDNPLTEADPDWQPLGAPGGDAANFTPAHPSYVSGHSTFGGAMFEVLRRFYGTDDVSFTLTSDELPGVTRAYSNFSEAESENALSRIYLGIHWSFDLTVGKELGQAIGALAVDRYSFMFDSAEPAYDHDREQCETWTWNGETDKDRGWHAARQKHHKVEESIFC